MSEDRRKFIQDLYIRVCQDSGFKMEYTRAAHLAGKVGGFHAMDVWTAMPSLQVMEQIAKGEHPAASPKSPTSETDQLGGVGAVMQKAVDAEWIATGLRVIADGNEAPCDFDRRILRRAADIIAPTHPASNARQDEGTVV